MAKAFKYQEALPEEVKKIIGKGPAFPLDTSSGETEINDGIDRLNQSIYIILATPLGEVWFNPLFGSRLHEYVFYPINSSLEAALQAEIIRALKENEPRISVKKVEFDRSQSDRNVLLIKITYQIVGSNIEAIYTYPFKLEPSGPYQT